MQTDGHVLEQEPRSDEPRKGVESVRTVSDEQHVPAQIEEPAELVTAADRLSLSTAGERGQMAGDEAGDHKAEEGDPVFRIVDVERPGRWE